MAYSRVTITQRSKALWFIRCPLFQANALNPVPNTPPVTRNTLSESGRSLRAEELFATGLADTMGKGKAEALGKKLFDIGALDILALLELDDTENLDVQVSG